MYVTRYIVISAVADLGIFKGDKLWGVKGHLPPAGRKFEIYDVFQANLPEYMPASNHQESYECE